MTKSKTKQKIATITTQEQLDEFLQQDSETIMLAGDCSWQIDGNLYPVSKIKRIHLDKETKTIEIRNLNHNFTIYAKDNERVATIILKDCTGYPMIEVNDSHLIVETYNTDFGLIVKGQSWVGVKSENNRIVYWSYDPLEMVSDSKNI